MGPKSNDLYPYEERRGHGRCREGCMKAEAKVGAMQLQAREHQTAGRYQKLGRGQEGSSPGAFRGSMVLPMP